MGLHFLENTYNQSSCKHSNNMKLESLHLKNFRAFKDVTMKHIPNFCVVVGANGTGKSTLFSVFDFLQEAMSGSVNSALQKLGGSRGMSEVRSRNTLEPMELELKFRQDAEGPLVTYYLQLNERNGKAYVARELLTYHLGPKGRSWHLLDFADGKGSAVTNEMAVLDQGRSESDLHRIEQTLKSSDSLAIKGLAQFENFPVIASLGTMIENWHVADFHIDKARLEQEAGYVEHLSRNGDNLPLVLQYLFTNHRHVFEHILSQLSRLIPGISNVEAKTTEEGRVLLRFTDGSFEDPFMARYVSDGTIKMLMYLVLLNDPVPHPLLCVEEPENQVYPSLLEELAEEFRSYAIRGGQVFVSTHSPDFLNAAELDEVFWLVKEHGFTAVRRAADDKQITAYMNDGDKMGYLWKQGLFEGVNP